MSSSTRSGVVKNYLRQETRPVFSQLYYCPNFPQNWVNALVKAALVIIEAFLCQDPALPHDYGYYLIENIGQTLAFAAR
jgi:hypothetical protein